MKKLLSLLILASLLSCQSRDAKVVDLRAAKVSCDTVYTYRVKMVDGTTRNVITKSKFKAGETIKYNDYDVLSN